jgi:8-oxo-dGTP pyrophosphatase MutT (NUDIX family)
VFARIIQYIEAQQFLHKLLLRIWRCFPPRLAGFLKGLLARSWVLGAVAVMIDVTVHPAQVLLVEHSYRRRGAWGLPGGALDSIPGDPAHPRDDESPDDVLEATLQKEVQEELGIRIDIIRMLRTDAVPYVVEEPGPYRLTFYFLCMPVGGFAAFRDGIEKGEISANSPEITRMKMVPLDQLDSYDLFSPDGRLLRNDLSRLLPHVDTGTH